MVQMLFFDFLILITAPIFLIRFLHLPFGLAALITLVVCAFLAIPPVILKKQGRL